MVCIIFLCHFALAQYPSMRSLQIRQLDQVQDVKTWDAEQCLEVASLVDDVENTSEQLQCLEDVRNTTSLTPEQILLKTYNCYCSTQLINNLKEGGCCSYMVFDDICNLNCDVCPIDNQEIKQCADSCSLECLEDIAHQLPQYQCPPDSCSHTCRKQARCVVQQMILNTGSCNEKRLFASTTMQEFEACSNKYSHRTRWRNANVMQYCARQYNLVSEVKERNSCCDLKVINDLVPSICDLDQLGVDCTSEEARQCQEDCLRICQPLNDISEECENVCDKIKKEDDGSITMSRCFKYQMCVPLVDNRPDFEYHCDDGSHPHVNGCCDSKPTQLPLGRSDETSILFNFDDTGKLFPILNDNGQCPMLCEKSTSEKPNKLFHKTTGHLECDCRDCPMEVEERKARAHQYYEDEFMQRIDDMTDNVLFNVKYTGDLTPKMKDLQQHFYDDNIALFIRFQTKEQQAQLLQLRDDFIKNMQNEATKAALKLPLEQPTASSDTDPNGWFLAFVLLVGANFVGLIILICSRKKIEESDRLLKSSAGPVVLGNPVHDEIPDMESAHDGVLIIDSNSK